MKARQLILGAAHGPETLSVLFEAFDAAWAEAASRFGNDPAGIETARLVLASIILDLANKGNLDPDVIKRSALKVFIHDRPARTLN